MFPVAREKDECGEGLITLPVHVTVKVGTPAKMEKAAMPGSKITPHGLPPHQSASLTMMKYRTVYINNLPIRTVGDAGTCGDVISSGVTTVKAA